MGFGFHSVEDAFASIARDMVKTASLLSLVANRIEKDAPEIEAISGTIYPPAVLMERAAFGLLGMAAQASTSVSDAAAAKGLNLQLDETAIRQLQQIAHYLKANLQSSHDMTLLEDGKSPSATL